MGKYRTAFGDFLDDLMFEKGIKSLTELGEKINVGKTTLSQYCTGTREPSDEVLIKIASYLDIDYFSLKKACLLDRYSFLDLLKANLFESLFTKDQLNDLINNIDEDKLDEFLKKVHKDIDFQKQFMTLEWNEFLNFMDKAGFVKKKSADQKTLRDKIVKNG